MNILQMLDNELKNKDWNIEEKARYLYIRSCELFSYDEKYYVYNSLNDSINSFNIRHRIIDLENVIDNKVICTSHAREVFAKILKELLNLECKEEIYNHAWASFYIGKKQIIADATMFSDLARVKMGLTTTGYRPMFDDYSFYEKIRIIDQKIGYIKRYYENYYLNERAEMLFGNFIESLGEEYSKYLEYSDDFLIYKLLQIAELSKKYDIKEYSDMKFCISYLIEKLIENDVIKMKSISLFQKDNGNFDFKKIYPFQLKNQIIYFILEKINNSFKFHEITKEDAKYYTKTLQQYSEQITT